MTIRRYLMKAIQDDAQRAGERGRLLLEAQRSGKPRRARPDPAAPARHLARLLFSWGRRTPNRATLAGVDQGTAGPARGQSRAC
ncbi:MAG TPA: hypothetical protein VHS30_14630 [Streptosporangiaceae bacterium]|jgi:hypothetical protein|nr:hypothetical protein [Streptosporangiaceae bacterium]